jgi:hypothetical protein
MSQKAVAPARGRELEGAATGRKQATAENRTTHSDKSLVLRDLWATDSWLVSLSRAGGARFLSFEANQHLPLHTGPSTAQIALIPGEKTRQLATSLPTVVVKTPP